MILNLHVNQMVNNESGTTEVMFTPTLINEPSATLQSPGNIFITLPNADNVFVLGADYQGDLTFVAHVKGVTISPATTTLAPNATQQLTPFITPTNATNLTVTYVSSDAAVATVSETGLVTAVTAGTATITAMTVDGGFTATTTVNA